jgi:hypothetical protein
VAENKASKRKKKMGREKTKEPINTRTMKKQGKEKDAIADLYGNFKNQFRNANLSILREVTYFYLRPNICVNTVKPRYSATVFSPQFVAYVEGGCKWKHRVEENSSSQTYGF